MQRVVAFSFIPPLKIIFHPVTFESIEVYRRRLVKELDNGTSETTNSAVANRFFLKRRQ